MPQNPAEGKIERNHFIDVLRGVSILLVICCHFPLFWRGAKPLIFGRPAANVREGFGYYGVAMFFVISGYLITRVTHRRYHSLRSVDPAQFWWMRFARIVPLLGLVLWAMILCHCLKLPGFTFASSTSLWQTVTSALSFRFSEVLGRADNGPWGPLWSLSIEELFYLLFPLVCLFISGWPAALWIGSFLLASGIYLRISGASLYSFGACQDLLCLGCLVAFAQSGKADSGRPWLARKKLRIWGGFAGVGIIIFSLFACHPFEHPEWAALRCAAGAALYLACWGRRQMPRWMYWVCSPVCALGVWSYEIYLLHAPALAFANVVAGASADPWVVLAGVLVAGGLAHITFTEPLNRLLRQALTAGRPFDGPRVLARVGAGVLGIGAAAALAALANRPLVERFRITQVARMEPGASEPIVMTGAEGAGDLVYLRHEADGMFRFGIDHWGGPDAQSAPFSGREIQDRYEACFAGTYVEVRTSHGTVVRNPVGAFDRRKAIFGRNAARFSTAASVAQSTVVGK